MNKNCLVGGLFVSTGVSDTVTDTADIYNVPFN